MLKVIKYKYTSDIETIKNIHYSNNVLYFNTNFGPKKFDMPNFFFVKNENENIRLIFDNHNKYNLVFRQLIRIFANSFRIFFFKLKLRGLGYKL
jgi:hypothetical protein